MKTDVGSAQAEDGLAKWRNLPVFPQLRRQRALTLAQFLAQLTNLLSLKRYSSYFRCSLNCASVPLGWQDLQEGIGGPRGAVYRQGVSVVWLRVSWAHLLFGEWDLIKMSTGHKPPTLCLDHMASILASVQILLKFCPQPPWIYIIFNSVTFPSIL